MSGTVSNIRIEPVDVSWQGEEQEIFDFASCTASGLGGQYVSIWSANDAVAYYAWFDENNTDTDPAPGGKTEIEVDYAASAIPTAIASAFSTAVNAVTGFATSVSGTKVTVTRTVAGATTDSIASTATSVAITKTADGGNLELGFCDGNIEVAMEEQTLEVTAHQTGTTLLADLRQGVTATVSLTLKETDIPKLKEIIAGGAGGSFTPVSGTELFGWGTSKQGTNTAIQARRLVLHPVNKLTSDKTRDLCFWKAYILPDTLTFSGEEAQTLSVSFKCYLDDSKDSAIKLFAYGDWSQLLPV